jgi:molybdate transport system substrate-binding protein
MNILRAFAAVTCAMQIASCASVPTAEVRVMAASAAAPALNEIANRYKQKTGQSLVMDYGILPVLKKKIDAGEAYDLVIVPNGLMNEAAKKERILANTRSPFARTGMAVATKSGAPKPDIRTVEAFKGALLGAKSVAYPPEGLVGVHLAKVFNSLGISDQMSAKTKALKTVELVPQAVSSGEAELGIAPGTVLSAGSGIDIVGPLPAELQSYVVLESAVGARAKQSSAARAFLQYLATPDAVGVMKEKGFEVTTQ